MKKLPAFLLLVVLLAGCQKDIDIDLPPAQKSLVVEAYINNWSPLMNYVIVSQTLDYFNPDLSVPGVSGCIVRISEGTLSGTDTLWAAAIQLPEIAPDTLPGIYFNPLLSGTVGKVYRLEVIKDNQYIHGITRIPEVVEVDSFSINLKPGPDSLAFLTAHFFDPPLRGNSYRILHSVHPDSTILFWGSIRDGDLLRDDEFLNGDTWDLQYLEPFKQGDTVQYFLNSIERPVYTFWDSYFDLRNNGGPFATPVTLKSTLQGGIGCFTGYGVSYRQIILK